MVVKIVMLKIKSTTMTAVSEKSIRHGGKDCNVENKVNHHDCHVRKDYPAWW
jgi:hypothetical protein